MLESLRDRPIARLPDRLRFDGRILLLVDDADAMRRQLAGEDLPGDPALYPLRDDISTDEITPGWVCFHYDEKLGDFPYVGLRAGGEFPITPGSVRAARFVASVSGKRRGKGSSREQSPFAEKAAGIRLVIAENIERIYRQNCQNLGLLTSTDFGLVERIRRGEEIPLEEFLQGEDPITREILRHGGLFAFNVARLQGAIRVPEIETPARPMSLAEKILARHMRSGSGRTGVKAVRPGDAGFVECDLRFSHEYVTPMASSFFEEALGAEGRIADPQSVLFFRDHLTFLHQVISPEKKAQGLLDLADRLRARQEEFARRQGVRLHGEIPGGNGSEGICHSLVLQNYALPGQVIAGTDSHTPHSGAVGALAFGVGSTDIFNAWITRDVRVRVPQGVLVRVRGRRPENVTAKDFMLALLAHPFVREGKAIGRIVEYTGEAVEQLSVDERATMTNMAAEVGAFTGIVAPDARTARFLASEREGLGVEEATRLCEGWASDPDCEWEKVIEIDAEALRPMVALPGDPGNGRPIEEVESEAGGPVRIEIAYGGSCTAGKREDMDMYARVLRDGLRSGRRVAPGVSFFIQFGSQEVKAYCRDQGYLRIFEDAGVRLIEPSCGACINAGPGVSQTKETVTVSAINRNFPGRSGPGQMYLASPLTVAASALAGRIVAYEPRKA